MKKLVSFILLAAMLLTFAACSAEPELESESADDAPDVTAEAFIGEWYGDRASMTVEEGENGAVTVLISWASSAFETTEWTYNCTVDAATGNLVSDNTASKVTTVYSIEDQTAEPVVTVEYSDGSASFTLENGAIIWSDNVENAGSGLAFTKSF